MKEVPCEDAKHRDGAAPSLRRSPRCPIFPRLPRHLLTGTELTREDIGALLHRALELKAQPLSSRALAGKSVALVFQRPSTRTRLSYEVGVVELGGHPLVLRPDEMQLSRGESVKDTARILSAHVHAVGVRTGPDALLEELAAEGSIPVFNMLTAGHHPVAGARRPADSARGVPGRPARPAQARLRRRRQQRRALAALMGTIAGVDVAVASPPGYELEPESGGTRTNDPREAVAGAHAVYTDVWVSMGDEDTADERRAALAPYRIDDALLDAAAPGAVALHCLPAHPGEEITAEVLYGARQMIWDQAENRRHAQKALLEWLLEAAEAERWRSARRYARREGRTAKTALGEGRAAARREARRRRAKAAPRRARRPRREGEGRTPSPRRPRRRRQGRAAAKAASPPRKADAGEAPRPRAPRRAGEAETAARRRAVAAARASRRRPRAPQQAHRRSRATGRGRARRRADRQPRDAARDLLAEHVVLTVERLQDALDDAVRNGRIMPDDAQDLGQRIAHAGRRQLDDLLAEVDKLRARR